MKENSIFEEGKKEVQKVRDEIEKIFSMNMETEVRIKKVFAELEKLNEIWHYGDRFWLTVSCMKHISREYGVPYFIVDTGTKDGRRSKKAMEIFLAAKPIGIQFDSFGFSPSTLYFLIGAATPYQSKRNRKIITTVKLPTGEKIRFIQREYPHLADVPAIENTKKGDFEPFSKLHGDIVFKESIAPIGHFVL